MEFIPKVGEDRITSISYPNSATNSFVYNRRSSAPGRDGLDTRFGKTDSSGTATYKRDGAGVTDDVLSDGAATYTPGVSRHTGSGTTFEGADYIGTNRVETNASQSVTGTRVYDAFGNLESTTGTPVGQFGYAGQTGYQEDSDSGLKLLGHRYYDSTTGRFLSRDSAKDGRNWNAYCAGSPTRYVDPSGNSWQGLVVGGLILALAIVLAPETGGLSVVIAIGGGTLAGAATAGTDYAVDYNETNAEGPPVLWNSGKFWSSTGWGALYGLVFGILALAPVVEALSPILKGVLRGPKINPGLSAEEAESAYYGGKIIL